MPPTLVSFTDELISCPDDNRTDSANAYCSLSSGGGEGATSSRIPVMTRLFSVGLKKISISHPARGPYYLLFLDGKSFNSKTKLANS